MANSEKDKKSILIVEDEDILREALADEFRLAHFDTFEAANVKEAISKLATNKVDGVLSDMRMPGGNGDILLAHVRTLGEKAPVFMFLTGYSELSDSDLYHRGAEKVFSKPFEMEKLLEGVSEQLRDKKSRWVNDQRTEPSAVIQGPSVNLGRGGFSFLTSEIVANVGQIVGFSVFVKDQKIEGSGFIRWIRNKLSGPSHVVGVEFRTLTPQSFDLLNNYLSLNLVNAYIPNMEEHS